MSLQHDSLPLCVAHIPAGTSSKGAEQSERQSESAPLASQALLGAMLRTEMEKRMREVQLFSAGLELALVVSLIF